MDIIHQQGGIAALPHQYEVVPVDKGDKRRFQPGPAHGLDADQIQPESGRRVTQALHACAFLIRAGLCRQFMGRSLHTSQSEPFLQGHRAAELKGR